MLTSDILHSLYYVIFVFKYTYNYLNANYKNIVEIVEVNKMCFYIDNFLFYLRNPIIVYLILIHQLFLRKIYIM